MRSRFLGEGGAGGAIILPTTSSLLSALNSHFIAVHQNTSHSFYSCLGSYGTVYSINHLLMDIRFVSSLLA